MLAAACALVAAAVLSDTPTTQDTAALAVALTHVRTELRPGAGPVLVATDTVQERIEPPGLVLRAPGVRMADPSQVREAAAAAGFAAGTTRDAIACEPGVCRATGVFRDYVYVLGVQEPDSDRVVVTLQMVELTVGEGNRVVRMDVKVDDVYLVRTSHESAWRIERVKRIVES